MKGVIIVKENDNLTEEQSDEILSDILGAAILFEQLPVEAQEELLALMREMLSE